MNQREKLLTILSNIGILRPRDLKQYGISPSVLYSLHQQGVVMRTGRGLYFLPDGDFTENHSLAEACKRAPNGVICLLSALRFHHLGTQNPFEVWLAIERKARRPQVDYPPLRVMYYSGQAFTEGIEEHLIEGVTVRVYSLPKTVVDCFKFRHKIGLDVAIEALQECRRARRCTHQELWRNAKICRVANVMQPYLEMV
ncbi:MAG: type IV toxin-antitoxin system AbiEi family antitoxin domain-containing protein [Caldilineaceae bacterium]